MRQGMNNFHLGLVVLSDVLKERIPRKLAPLEEGHLEEAAYTLERIAEVIQWLDAGNLRPGNIPPKVFEYYDRAEKVLDCFGRKAETVEFIAKSVDAIAKRRALSEGNRIRLLPLAKKLETAFDPFSHRQFERSETIHFQGKL